jgi:hypothetical protein
VSKIILTLGIVAVTFLIPAAADASTGPLRSENQAESYIANHADDWYADYAFDDVSCDGYGWFVTRHGTDLFRKFQCETDFVNRGASFVEGFTNVDRVKARSWGFTFRTIDSYWWN